ncbi:TlpA family protein disulfide reductase [Lysobacter auxotrophicus]|uniref:TlpA family protein disulfide reductase n=1 Tax=Lysobacter auxotrophicus TaxID=2992573 RepID=A0ABM8DHH6_9GAMM|nr:TlpA disulfide reductase family protein [Lysobacter auxotrophicus]BDU18041.1 TlpA family protein disulfide reductase [Lysobacter auxotrophicus]
MGSTAKILLVAAIAGALGVAAGLLVNGPGPLLRTEVGQRALQSAMDASAPKPPADLPVARRGEAIPTIRLPALDGAFVELPSAYAGRPVLVNLWASWCGPCIEEMPELDRFAASQGANGTQVVGIALDDAAAVEAFLKRIPVRYPILLDDAGPRDAGVQLGNPKGVLPYTALISADGRLIKQKIGPFQHGEIDNWVAD